MEITNINNILDEIYDHPADESMFTLNLNCVKYYDYKYPFGFRLVGEIKEYIKLIISGKYNLLDLSNVKCKKIIYTGQSDDSIKNHLLPIGLEKLICINQPITDLPIRLPHTLKKLDCSGCKISSLPDKLPTLLEELIANDNEIESIDNVTFPLLLKDIKLYDNPIKNTEKITNYLREIKGEIYCDFLDGFYGKIDGDDIYDAYDFSSEYDDCDFYK